MNIINRAFKTFGVGKKRTPLNTVTKSISQTRADIQIWKKAINSANMCKPYLLHNLIKDIEMDLMVSNQLENRRSKTLKTNFSIYNENKEKNEEITELLNNSSLINKLNEYTLDSIFYGHSLVQFIYENGEYKVELLPRQNVIIDKGILLTDYTDDSKFQDYRNSNEYNSWVLEFGDVGTNFLLNKVVPYVLFKKFARSCWSELGQIYGIPPRVMKTDTQNPQAVARAEKMMLEASAAASFIIDETEKFEFAKGIATNGDIFKNQIESCDNEISMGISGAIIGQDTKNGARSKDESARSVLQEVVDDDLKLLQSYWNDKILPALINIGFIPNGEYNFKFDIKEDLDTLFKRTSEFIRLGKNIPNDFIENKFGIPVLVEPTDKKLSTKQNNDTEVFC